MFTAHFYFNKTHIDNFFVTQNVHNMYLLPIVEFNNIAQYFLIFYRRIFDFTDAKYSFYQNVEGVYFLSDLKT